MQLKLSENKQFLQIINATQDELDQLNLSLKVRVDGYRFNPLYKKGVWDGYISFIKNDKWIPTGLWQYILDIADEYKLNCNIEGLEDLISPFEFEELDSFVKDYFKNSDKFQVRDYQIKAAFNILKNYRSLHELATSAGKTFITFLVFSFILNRYKNAKILFIVPNVNLVVQAFSDFTDYNYEGKTPLNMEMVYAGQTLKEDSNIVIGTYQSLVKKDKKYFDKFNVVGVDEVHTAKSASIKTILSKCLNTTYRFGLTGTIPKGESDKLTVMSQIGPVLTKVKANTLQKQGYISKCAIYVLELDYVTEKEREAFFKISRDKNQNLFNLEKKFVRDNTKRFSFLTKFIPKLKNNTLVLFHSVEYGTKMYKEIKNNTDRKVYYIDGGTNVDSREEFKRIMETEDDVILIASFGTLSTGVSIKKIHNIVFTESFKSDIIIKQSIGRGLRLHNSKDKVVIYDITDDLSYKGWNNYLKTHSKNRIEIYKRENFPYKIKKIKL